MKISFKTHCWLFSSPTITPFLPVTIPLASAYPFLETPFRPWQLSPSGQWLVWPSSVDSTLWWWSLIEQLIVLLPVAVSWVCLDLHSVVHSCSLRFPCSDSRASLSFDFGMGSSLRCITGSCCRSLGEGQPSLISATISCFYGLGLICIVTRHSSDSYYCLSTEWAQVFQLDLC